MDNISKKRLSTTRRDLALKIEERFMWNAEESKFFVNTFFESLKERLTEGETVKLPSFGVFSIIEKDARPGRNVSTGEVVEVSARTVVRFKASKKVRIHDDSTD